MPEKKYLFQSNIFDVYENMDEMRKVYIDLTELDERLTPSDDEVVMYLSEDNFMYFSDFIDNLPIDTNHRMYLVLANIGRWNGRFEGGNVIKGLSQVISQIIEGEDDFEIYYEGRTLCIDTHNHDASSYFEIYELTPKGEAYFERNSGFYQTLSDRELHKRLRDVKCYTKNVPNWTKFDVLKLGRKLLAI